MDTKNILIVGVGGQGTLLTSRVLGKLALDLGCDVKLSEVHGMAQRGGSVVTHVKYGEKIYSPLVEVGKADIILAFEKLEALRWVQYLKKDGLIIVNTQEINPMPVIIGLEEYPTDIEKQLQEVCKNVIFVNAVDIAREIGNIRVVNTILLGEISKHLKFSKEQWEKAIKTTVPPKTVDINLKAFKMLS